MAQFAFGETLKLGRLVKEYRKSSANVAKVIIVSLISVAIASFFFLGAFSMSNDLAGRIVLSIVGLFFLLPALFGVYMLVRGRGATLSLHENGLLYRRGGKESAITWDEIDSYAQETNCRIAKKDGEIIEFGLNIDGVDEVATKIQEETSKRMLPRMKAAILNGQSIEFKGVKLPVLSNVARAYSGFYVDAEGISTMDGGERIVWQDVTEFGVTEGQIGSSNRAHSKIDLFFIQDQNKSFETRLGLLENAHVLLAICDELITSPKSKVQSPKSKV